MNRKKKFDCVEMKWKIQQKIEKEYAGMTDKEKYMKFYERIKNNPELSKFIYMFEVKPAN